MSRGVRKKLKMTNLTVLNNSCSLKYALKLVPGLADVGVLHGVGYGSTLMSRGVRKKFKMTNHTILNNSCSLRYALKLVPGLADVGDLHGVGGGPIAPS